LPLAELRRLSSVAAKAGAESLPVSRSAVRQLLEPRPPGGRGGGPFVVEVALTPGQKEQIGRATGNVFASLRIGPDDVPVAYRETWDDETPVRVGRMTVVKPAGKPTKRRAATWSWSCPRATAPGGACSARGATRRRA
jgi:hypothetical protein